MDIKDLEKNMKVCKVCMILKLRIVAGKFNERSYKYIDNRGKLWNGRVCPDCHKNVCKNNMRDLREREASSQEQLPSQ